MIKLSLVTVGAQTTQIQTKIFSVFLKDLDGVEVEVEAIGLERISTLIRGVNTKKASLILGIDEAEINRPVSGEIDMLIGLQYAAYHPAPVSSKGHLILYSNRFGTTIGGSHPEIQEETRIDESCSKVRGAVTMHATHVIDSFFEVESLGVTCLPKCGSCKCGRCHPGGKEMSLKDELEYNMIQDRVTFNQETGRWVAEYPWIKDPRELPDNRKVAMATLKSTERRLLSNEEHKKIYSLQIEDMLNRKVARRVTEEELINYVGPKFYLSHHAVLKPESKSTPCRIVFNSSAKYMGLSLNECLAKGPSLLNVLLGVLLRFRHHRFGFIGDISKMYHSIDITLPDQMMHLFLWRDCEETHPPKTYAITAVNMGDRPSATIAQIALRKTAEDAVEEYPVPADIVTNNAYMDDILGSVVAREEAMKIMDEIDKILGNKGFKIKEWIHNSSKRPQASTEPRYEVPLGIEKEIETEGVLGLRWDVENDDLKYKFSCSWKVDGGKLTKRTMLSVANSIYDPVGLLTPFSTKAKIVIRSTWAHEPKLGWDSQLPRSIEEQWKQVMVEIPRLTELKFQRTLTPQDSVGKPMMIIFSDGSEHAYGAVAYLRWKTQDGRYESRLIMAKSRMAPLKTVDIVRIELCGAVLSKRLRATILKEMQPQLERVIHLVDSEIVHAMIHKQSYGFNTFVANRVGEIQQSTNPNEWAWVPGKLNIADVASRGCSPEDLNSDSDWQKGPQFLGTEIEQWPIKFEVNKELHLPEMKAPVSHTQGSLNLDESTETLANRIDVERFSNWKRLQRVTAWILKLYQRFNRRFNASTNERAIEPSDLEAAELFWIKEAQRHLDTNKLVKLRPINEDGIIVVGGRTERWMACTWNKQKFVLLPKDSKVSTLIALYEHQNGGHLGLAASISKVRSKYWIVGIRTMMKRIIHACNHCKEKLKALQEQVMSPLPVERIMPSPAFHAVGLDYFGPYMVKGEVQKRVRGKAYGVIFTCFSSRAVYVDLAHDLSTDGFLQVLRRFSSLRGWPAKFHCDNGTQLVGASNELKSIVSSLSWSDIESYGHSFGATWEFSPPDGKWYNGAAEALVKSVKRALNAAIGQNILQFSELQTCLFEAAELVNERPIGVHPSSPEEGVYLCPNDLLLGRTTNKVPQGPFRERTSDKYRFDFLESIVKAFWKKWIREVFPNMLIQPKWHTEQRNCRKGDVVLVQDLNSVRGQWKMALVEEAIISMDGKVRRVLLSYKSPDNTRITVERPVQKLIILVPNEN